VNRSISRIGVIATVALSALFLSAAGSASAVQPFAKHGVINACVKAKGKNRGALRLVTSKRGCKKLRGWRAMSWTASRAGNQTRGATGSKGEQGPQGDPGPEGKQGPQGTSGAVEQSLVDTIQAQSLQINELTEDMTDLAGEMLTLEGNLSDLTGGLGDVEGEVGNLTAGLTDLEGTVGNTCDQLELLTDQSNDILNSLLGSSVAVLGNLLNVPSPPDELATFECG
jgi:hypothetical protein